MNASEILGHQAKIIQTTEIYDKILIYNFFKQYKRHFRFFRKYVPCITELHHDLLLVRKLLNAVKSFQPDIVFLHFIDSYYTHLAIKKIRELGSCVVIWLGVHPDNVSKGIRKILKKCNFTLIYDPSYVDYYKFNLCINNVRVVPLGCETNFYESVTPDDQFLKKNQTDICFIGMFDEHREKYLKELINFELGIWSWNIGDYNTDLKKYYRGVVYGKDLVGIIKSSKISINIHRASEISGGNFRLFEIPACGIMQIVDNKKNISEYFEPAKEIVTFNDPKELKDKVKYYLTHTSEREKIARAGFERVKRDHSLVDRMKRIITICEER